jgi:hypothetical protein
MESKSHFISKSHGQSSYSEACTWLGISFFSKKNMRKHLFLVQIGNKEIVVGEKINGEFIMASPCKVSGDRFDVMEQEIVLSSKHTGEAKKNTSCCIHGIFLYMQVYGELSRKPHQKKKVPFID